MRARQADLLHLSGVLDAALEYEDYISEVNSGSRVADHSHWLYLSLTRATS
ncbi:MAG: hypothetical protein HC842_00250 [Cytophagales bacterium]|nr:hypothetical protein [Cytophagales bacterium]